MIITYLGKQFFKIQQGELTIAINPITKHSKRFGSDVVFVTTNHPDYNGVETVIYGDKKPLIISGPGDYEAKGIFAKGLMTESELGKKKYINTVYSLSVDGINICFLGVLSSPDLSTETRQAIGDPDILFVPIGGGDTLSPAAAYKLSLSFQPKIIIPMDYNSGGKEKELKTFLKEGGAEKIKEIEKLTIKKKDLAGKEGEIIVLHA